MRFFSSMGATNETLTLRSNPSVRINQLSITLRGGPWTIVGAVIAVVVDKKLEILHVAEKTERLDHLQLIFPGGSFRHLNKKPHKVSHNDGSSY